MNCHPEQGIFCRAKDLGGPIGARPRASNKAPKGRFLICLLSGISTAHVGTAALGCPPCFAEALSTAKGKSRDPALSEVEGSCPERSRRVPPERSSVKASCQGMAFSRAENLRPTR